jgi:hypothetical protein
MKVKDFCPSLFFVLSNDILTKVKLRMRIAKAKTAERGGRGGLGSQPAKNEWISRLLARFNREILLHYFFFRKILSTFLIHDKIEYMIAFLGSEEFNSFI